MSRVNVNVKEDRQNGSAAPVRRDLLGVEARRQGPARRQPRRLLRRHCALHRA
jgi:hypothetical protein